MSGRRAEPYQGLGKNKLEYVRVVPKFLQAVSRPPPPPPENDDPELEEKEEKELIERMMREQKEDEEKRREFYAEKGGKDPNPAREPEPEPEPEPESDAPSVDENGKILFKRQTKHKREELQKSKESKSKKSKIDIKKQITPKPSKKETAAAKNTTLLSFEDDE